MLKILLLLMLTINPATKSDRMFVASDSLYNFGILELGNRNGWRFHPGDDLNRANPDFDDSDWMYYKPSVLYNPIPDSLWNGYGWFRFRFAADSSAYAMSTHLYFYTWGAAEVYLDGRLVEKYGSFSTDLQGEKRYMPKSKIFPSVEWQPRDSHLLAVRYSYHKGPAYKKLLGNYAGTFGFDIGLATENWNQNTRTMLNVHHRNYYILSTMMFLIVLLHGFLFLLFPAERSNLYIAIVASLLFLHVFGSYAAMFYELDWLLYLLFIRIPYVVLFMAALSMFPLTLSSMFNQRQLFIHKFLIWSFPVFAMVNFILSGPEVNVGMACVYISGILFLSSRILIQAWRNNQKGVWFVSGGFSCFIVSAVTIIFYLEYASIYRYEIHTVLTFILYSSIPLGLTAFMASRFRDLYTHLEQKVTERTRALNQSLEDLQSTQSQLIQSEKMASLGALTAGIAHEIQNPLNFVNNFSEVNFELIGEMEEEIDKGNLEEAKKIAGSIRENQQKINHHGKRADGIVKGMLQHSRSSSGIKELTDINVLADEFLRLSYHGLRARDKSFNATLKSDFDSSIGKIRIVSDEIGRVILNLLNNAFYAVSEKRKLNPEGYEPSVSISTHKVGNQVEIRVQDNGNGIPQNVLDKIFHPFFTTKPAGMGTGLGLSMSYDMVKAHGGELKVKTAEGAGTEFIIHLPF